MINKNNNEQIVLKTIKSGDVFNVLSFFINKSSEETAISSSFSTVYKISRRDFLQILSEFPLDYVKF